MRALELAAQHEDFDRALANLHVVSKPVPRPGKGQVLVKIEAASCNPSDLLFLRGLYKVDRTMPNVPGFEAAGTVVASGGGLLGAALVGRRVACGGQADVDGTWAEYFLADAQLCIPLSRKLSFDEGASMIVNPMTALAFMDMVRRGKHKAVAINAAAGQLGRMLVHLLSKAGVPTLCIVRRDEEAQALRALGAASIILADSLDFGRQLRDECHRLGATIAFDAVGGHATGEFVTAMPAHSTVVVYGFLSEDPATRLDPAALIFEDKRIESFWLSTWLQNASLLQRFMASNRAARLIGSGNIATAIRRRVGLDQTVAALAEYHAEMGKGRVLITPQLP